MPWMFQARGDVRHLQEKLTWLEASLAQARGDRDYWKDKAERLLDAALFKRGEVTAPVFTKAERPKSPFAMPTFLGGLNVTEIESGKGPAA
jgi:hypothetical protein